MLRPEPKMLVAVGERLMELEPVPPIERKVPGVVVPRPRYPLASMVSAAVVEVAVPATVVVAMYRRPPALRKAHWEKPAPEERASWEAVAELGFKSHVGVVVPMPTRLLVVSRESTE